MPVYNPCLTVDSDMSGSTCTHACTCLECSEDTTQKDCVVWCTFGVRYLYTLSA